MGKLYINVINFNSDELAGAGNYFKRIISNINFDSAAWNKVDEIIFLSNSKVNAIKLFNFTASSKIKVISFPCSSNFFLRILYEQIVFPIFLFNKKGVFYSPTPAIPLLLRLVNRNVILVPTVHDMIPFKVKNKYSLLRTTYVKYISKKSSKISKIVITVSEHSKKDIAEIAKVLASKIEVIYNFIPELKYDESGSKLPYFITISTIEPGKNIENMIKGFFQFVHSSNEFKDYKFKIVGKLGWNYKAILLLVKNLNLESNVEFTGYLDDTNKNDLLKKASGMIYLSKYEGFGIPPLEAMYFNKVSIVSNTSSLAEVVGAAGILQNPDDIEGLAENLKNLTNSTKAYENKIKVQLEKFNPVLQLAKFENLILSLYD